MISNIFIIGHKNPDTDSICAAIAYAKLKQSQGENNVVPARAGNLNLQTEFVLSYFGVPAPLFLPDITPNVGHAMSKEVIFCNKNASLKELLAVMEKNNIRLIPLVDERDCYCGIVSLFDIAHGLFREVTPLNSREIFTSVKYIHAALGGKLLNAYHSDDVFQGIFLVGAMQELSFGKVLSGLDHKKCIVITGDREEIQEIAIENGVRALVVTGGLSISEEIRRMAVEHNVNLLVSPYDTATTLGFVRLSTPAYRVAQNYDGTFTADELLEEAQLKILKAYNRGMAVLNEEHKITGIITMADFLKFSKPKLILIDHNEISQSVDGADQCEIMEIIDHHRLANRETLHPILFINQPVGSTCTLISRLYFEKNIEIDPKTAGLLISGIISDTVNLKSPTTTALDKEMMERLNNTAKLDLEIYSAKLLASGVNIAGRSPEEIILSDFKEYKTGKITFGVGQIELVGFSEFDKIKHRLTEELVKIRRSRKYNFSALLVTDISVSNSLLVFDGDVNLCRRLGYPLLEPHIAELKGVLSRKKQLAPHLLSIFKET
ncbi:MAG: putative manganese-dependent inorganic diphosphatase [bacterium]